mmetsp:Transcript_14136/g.45270  ORF Transcript_14136/g.45270 Transcript_14136/m.45270 type:complete len:519 (-) Transcript_14136:76-1632(-)
MHITAATDTHSTLPLPSSQHPPSRTSSPLSLGASVSTAVVGQAPAHRRSKAAANHKNRTAPSGVLPATRASPGAAGLLYARARVERAGGASWQRGPHAPPATGLEARSSRRLPPRRRVTVAQPPSIPAPLPLARASEAPTSIAATAAMASSADSSASAVAAATAASVAAASSAAAAAALDHGSGGSVSSDETLTLHALGGAPAWSSEPAPSAPSPLGCCSSPFAFFLRLRRFFSPSGEEAAPTATATAAEAEAPAASPASGSGSGSGESTAKPASDVAPAAAASAAATAPSPAPLAASGSEEVRRVRVRRRSTTFQPPGLAASSLQAAGGEAGMLVVHSSGSLAGIGATSTSAALSSAAASSTAASSAASSASPRGASAAASAAGSCVEAVSESARSTPSADPLPYALPVAPSLPASDPSSAEEALPRCAAATALASAERPFCRLWRRRAAGLVAAGRSTHATSPSAPSSSARSSSSGICCLACHAHAAPSERPTAPRATSGATSAARWALAREATDG